MRSIPFLSRGSGPRHASVIGPLLLAAAGTLHASDASACTPGTDPSCVCALANPTWNAPPGAVVFSRSPGVLTPMFDALGEYRSHTMMSTGINGMVIHNTASPAKAGTVSCNLPLSGPSFSQPGFMAVQQQDIFDYLFSVSNGQLTGPEFLAFQVPSLPLFEGSFVSEANLITTGATNPSGLGGIPTSGPNGPQFNATYLGNQFTYDFHSFIDGATLGMGEPTPFTGLGGVAPYYAPGNGGVCSSTAAFMQTRTIIDQGMTYAGGWVLPKTYPHSLLYGGGSLGVGGDDPGVAQALFASVYNVDPGSFWDDVGLALYFDSCQIGGQNILENAANQVLNCVANQQCGSNANTWQGQVVAPSFTATSITDDTLGGWNGGPVWRTLPGEAPAPEEGASVWANGSSTQVQWSGAGTSVVCMDMPTPPTGPTGSTPSGDVSTSAFTPGEAPYLAITEISPTVGSSKGGTTVTIQGAQFSTTPGATQVYFNGYPATQVTCSSSTLCTAVTPAFEEPDYNALVGVQVVVGSANSANAPLAPNFEFQYIGQGPICSTSYWTCTGSNNQESDAVFECQAPADAGAAGQTFELLREQGGTYVPVANPYIYESNGSLTISELGFVPSPSPSQTNYEICFINGNLGTVCTPPITLTTSVCQCLPNTCESVNACNGSYSDGCGGTITCGACPTGDVCSAGVCDAPKKPGPPIICKGTTCS